MHPAPRIVLWFLAVWAPIALLLSLIGCADWFLLHPSTGPVSAGGAAQLVVASGVGDVQVYVTPTVLARERGTRGHVLFFCGNASRAERAVGRMADRWREAPVEVWAVNYPGYGGSGGDASLRRIPPCADAVFDELARRAAGRPIFVEGNSLGSAAALHLAAHRDVAGVVLQNPPPLPELVLRRHGWWNLWLLAIPVALSIPGELDSVENAAHVDEPVVVFSARRDNLVPPGYQRLVIDALGDRAMVIEVDGGHNNRIDRTARARWDEHLRDWWRRTDDGVKEEDR